MSYSPLTPEFTEDRIKAELDGTLTRFDVLTGGVKTARVDHNHQPSHDISGGGGGSAQGVKKPNYRRFDPDDDKMIIAMKAKGFSARRIAIAIGRDDDTGINKRYRRMIATGRCQAVVS